MRGLLATVLGVLAVTAHAQDRDAERLFRAMEKKGRAAKSLKMVVTVHGRLSRDAQPTEIWASQQFADADKARFEIRATTDGQTERVLFVSDGKRTVEWLNGRAGEPKPAAPRLNEGLPAAIARGGFMLPRLIYRREPGAFDADKLLQLSRFKLGPKERVGKVDGQAVDYAVTLRGLEGTSGESRTVKVRVWIDPRTLVPLKRTVVGDGWEGPAFTEVYSEFVVDPKLDAKRFALPKEALRGTGGGSP
jgi:outer membrane lipoprotein-sorting protein